MRTTKNPMMTMIKKTPDNDVYYLNIFAIILVLKIILSLFSKNQKKKLF